MKVFKVLIQNDSVHPVDIQKWLKENKIKHEPTEKRFDGWVFRLNSEEDAMAVKLKWH